MPPANGASINDAAGQQAGGASTRLRITPRKNSGASAPPLLKGTMPAAAAIGEAVVSETGVGDGQPARRGRPALRRLGAAVGSGLAGARAEDFKRWRRDPVAFIQEVLVDPETGAPFVLNRAEKRFVRRAFALTKDGRLKHPELVYSGPKKSGKTGFAGMLELYVIVILGGPFAEGICVANDLEQAKGRVFESICRIVAASPLLAADALIGATKIVFRSSGSTITAIASDYAGAAGANPTITCFDELWAYTSEKARRLWDEMVPPPTSRPSRS
jgi:hypothetical protein